MLLLRRGLRLVQLVVERLVDLELLLRVLKPIFFLGGPPRIFPLGRGRGEDGLVAVVDVVVLLDEVVERELNRRAGTSRFQWCCSRMLAASVGSWMLERSQSLRICSICSGRSHSRSMPDAILIMLYYRFKSDQLYSARSIIFQQYFYIRTGKALAREEIAGDALERRHEVSEPICYLL